MAEVQSSGIDVTLFNKDWQKKIKPGEKFQDSTMGCISTGSIKLDWALKFPIIEGQIVEIFAENAVGKTTLALEIAANATRNNRHVFYIDLEYKLREVQINMIPGIQREYFTVVHPDTGEEAMNMMHEFIVSFPGCLIIFDSVGAILPEVEGAEDYGKQHMTLVARLCHQMIRKITGIASRNKSPIVFLNHPTSTMKMYGPKTTTHGGKAIKNRAAQRIELKALKADEIKNDENEKIGQWVTATVIKNNVNRPQIQVKYPLIYGQGIFKELEILDFAKGLAIIDKKKGWCSLIDEEGSEIKMREKEILIKLATDEKFRNYMLGKIRGLID